MNEVKQNETCPFQVNDRVKRKEAAGCHGVVTELRKELVSAATKEENPPMIRVFWDDGMSSYMSPSGLEHVREG